MVEQTAPAVFQLGEPDVKRILHGFAVREEILGLLCNAPRGDAIGAALAFLINAAQRDPGQLRAVLNTPHMHNGRPVRMIDLITQVVR